MVVLLCGRDIVLVVADEGVCVVVLLCGRDIVLVVADERLWD